MLGGTRDDHLIENKGDIGVFVGIEHVYAKKGEFDFVAIELIDQILLTAFEVVDLYRGIARPIGAKGVCKAVLFRQGERTDAQGVRAAFAIHLEAIDGAVVFRKHLAHILAHIGVEIKAGLCELYAVARLLKQFDPQLALHLGHLF